jgi:hypothetical protein
VDNYRGEMMYYACDDHGSGASSSSRLQAFASRTLDFLQLIEKTVGRLASDSHLLRVYTEDVGSVNSDLATRKFDREIDPEGRISDLLLKAAATARRMHADAIEKRESARRDPDLSEDDGVVEAFGEYLVAVASYHDAVEHLRDTLESLDSLRSPVVGDTYDDVDALVRDMLSS